MRTHDRHRAFLCWREPRTLARLVSPGHLAAARIENTIGRMLISLDLMFFDGSQFAVLPFVELEWAMLDEMEISPFIWPQRAAASISHGTATAIERKVLPWLQSLYFSRAFNGEQLRHFAEGRTREFVEDARERGFLGAAPYTQVSIDLSPYAYAARFAAGKRVSIRDPHGAAGAALLARYACEVSADLLSEDANAAARRWFGTPIFGKANSEADVFIGSKDAQPVDASIIIRTGLTGAESIPIATPVPNEILLSFDPEDAPAAAHFAVDCRIQRPQRAAFRIDESAARGSSGRIVLLMRDDWLRIPDADSDASQALAAALRAEGFAVDFATAAQRDAIRSCDLLHAFAHSGGGELPAALRLAREERKPVVWTPGIAYDRTGAAWGEGIIPAISRLACDEMSLEEYLALVALRSVQGDGLPAPASTAPQDDLALRETLTLVDAVLATGPLEAGALRNWSFDGHVEHVPALLRMPQAPERIERLLGTGDFVLVHAPIAARCNQLLLLRAAAALSLPVVLAGPFFDGEYYRMLREISDERVMFVPEPDAGTRTALYHSARVFADLGWRRPGLQRVAEAAASGCAVVVSRGTDAPAFGGAAIFEADPADQAAIQAALSQAWNMSRNEPARLRAAAERVPELCGSRGALLATVKAYAAAQARAGALISTASSPKY